MPVTREAKRAAEASLQMEMRFPNGTRHDHAPKGRVRVWVPGHYEMRQVERRLPDRYEWRTVTVRLPDRYEWRSERVWVEGAPVYREERYKIRSGRWEARVSAETRRSTSSARQTAGPQGSTHWRRSRDP